MVFCTSPLVNNINHFKSLVSQKAVEAVNWFHRNQLTGFTESMASALNFPTFDPSSLPQTQSPADMDVSWLIYCSCSGYAFSCKNQCHPFCNYKSKSFCTSSASSCTCDSKTSEISSYVNRSDFVKCCCFQQLSQYATAEPLGKFGWCNYSSVCKQFCVESSSSTKCVVDASMLLTMDAWFQMGKSGF